MSTGLKSGTVVAERYEILERMGQGAFSEVYRARQLSTGQIVAMKVLLIEKLEAEPSARNIMLSRFDREMKLVGRLKHPNIIRLIDSGQLQDQRPFAVLEYVDGQPLHRVLASSQTLSGVAIKRLMIQVIEALSAAHAEGIVHRDLNPRSIIVSRSHSSSRMNAKVVDFGVAALTHKHRDTDYRTLTQTGEILGSPAYLAPEQIRGEATTTQSDIYAWGMVLLEMLTGKSPFEETEPLIQLVFEVASLNPVPIPASIRDPTLRRVLERATAKNIADRYPSDAELLTDFETWQPEKPSRDKPGSRPLLLASLATLMLIGTGLAFFLLREPAPAEAPPPAPPPIAQTASTLPPTRSEDVAEPQDLHTAAAVVDTSPPPVVVAIKRLKRLTEAPFIAGNRWMYRFERIPGEDDPAEGNYSRYFVIWTSLGARELDEPQDTGQKTRAIRITEQGGPADQEERERTLWLTERCLHEQQRDTEPACITGPGELKLKDVFGGTETVELGGHLVRVLYAPRLGMVEYERILDDGDVVRLTLLGFEIGGQIGGLPVVEPKRCDWDESRPVKTGHEGEFELALSGLTGFSSLHIEPSSTPGGVGDVVLEPTRSDGKSHTVKGYSSDKEAYSTLPFGRIKSWKLPDQGPDGPGSEIVVIERVAEAYFNFVVLILKEGRVHQRVVLFPAPQGKERYRSLLMQYDATCFVRFERKLKKTSLVADFALSSNGLKEDAFFGSLVPLQMK